MKEDKLKKEQQLPENETGEKMLGGMPKKTAYFVVALVGITIVLLMLAIYNFNQSNQLPTIQQTKSTSPSYARAILTIDTPQPTVNANGSKVYTATIKINTPATGYNAINAAQLDLSYDPRVLTNVDIKAGPLMDKPVELLKKIDTQKGTINYDLAASPSKDNLGYVVGNLAVLTFTVNPSAKGTTAINFLPTTIVTSAGFSQSVLQGAYGMSFNLNSQ